MKIKTSDLSGAALDWAVGIAAQPDGAKLLWRLMRGGNWRPSTDWSQGGPIIEREGICLKRGHSGYWFAYTLTLNDDERHMQCGAVALAVAMRCFVASKLGDEVDVPEELL